MNTEHLFILVTFIYLFIFIWFYFPSDFGSKYFSSRTIIGIFSIFV